MRKGVAFFDLDGTITLKDTFIDFIKFCRGNLIFYLGLIFMSPYIFLYIFKFYPNYKLKELFFTYYLARYHKVIIITASCSIWLSEWCKSNNLKLIGTKFKKTENKYTGKILGKNCHGLQKQKIVDNILRESVVSSTYGYGDSKADLLFLNRLRYSYYKPHWV